MYGGFPGSAITPALLSPAEATGAVAVSSSAEPTAPEASLTSRYLLDDFSKVQQTAAAAQVQPHPFGMANGGGRKRQAYYEARRQPDKLDFSSIRGKEEGRRTGERERERVIWAAAGSHLSRFNCSLSGGVDILAPRNAFANDDEEAGGRRGGGTREESGRTHLSVVRSCSLAPTAKCETAMIIRPSTRQS